MMTTIEMEVGAWCYCDGEGHERFTVGVVCDKAAALINEKGYDHGLESFTKLHRGEHFHFRGK